jgi:DNA-binding transcriptional MerR regulator
MREQLQIGEVARLLGITTKAVRHYHKLGLLAEPPRSEGGYRLYNGSDLLRLQRIRRLQGLGLALKQIKQILGGTNEELSVRQVLEALRAELAAQIEVLEARRERIDRLLAEETLPDLEQPFDLPPSLARLQEQLGDQLGGVSKALWEQEAKLYGLLDGFAWPSDHQEQLNQMTAYVSEHPEQYQQWLALGERIAALATMDEDAAEVEELAEELVAMIKNNPLLGEMAAEPGQLPGPFAETLQDMTMETLSPAQRQLFQMVSHYIESENRQAARDSNPPG